VKLLTDKQTNRQTEKQQDKQTDRQTNRQTDKQRVKHNLVGGGNNAVVHTAVTAEDLLINDSDNRQTIEAVCECFPQLDTVPSLAYVHTVTAYRLVYSD